MITLLVLLGLLAPSMARAVSPEWVGRPVVEVRIRNRSRVSDREVRRLFRVVPGRAYEPEAVQRGVEMLGQKISVGGVVVRGKSRRGEIVLTVDVEPRLLVRSYGIRGNKGFRDTELEVGLVTKVDHPVDERLLRTDREYLASVYHRSGYPEASVTTEVIADDRGQWARVIFRIDPGRPLLVGGFEASEPLPVSSWTVWRRLGLWPGRPASLRSLEGGRTTLEQTLQREGYPEARLRSVRFETRGDRAVVVLDAVLGRRTDLEVDGLAFGAGSLLEEAQSRFGQPVDDDWIAEVGGAMTRRLQLDGYPDALVVTDVEEGSERRRIRFRVTTGAGPFRVGRVRFVGNANVPDDDLRPYVGLLQRVILRRPPFSREALDRDAEGLRRFYLGTGYLEAKVIPGGVKRVSSNEIECAFRIEEGPRYRWGEVRVEGVAGDLAHDLVEATGLGTGGWVVASETDAARRRVLEKLSGRGYLDAKVRHRLTRRSEDGRVDVSFRVNTGKPYRFGKVVVSGNARTRTKVITRELTFHEGDPWNREKVAEDQRRLYRLGFFERVRIEPLPSGGRPGFRDVLVKVEEHDAGSVVLGLGYATEERLKVRASVAHTNLGGYGRSLGLRVDVDQIDSAYAVNFREPWLFNHPTDLRVSIIRGTQTHDSFDLLSRAFQISLEKAFWERVKGSLQYTLSWDEVHNVSPGAALTPEDRGGAPYRAATIGPLLVWDATDDPFNPSRGFRFTAQAEWALPALGSQVTYEKYTAGGVLYGTWRRNTLALSAKGGLALSSGRVASLPINRRFFLGGRSTIRGFPRNEVGPRTAQGASVGGDVMLNLRAEIRRPLVGALGGVLFWDGGNVWNRSLSSPGLSDIRHAAGWGFRYRTPVGPVAFDVGYKLDRKTGESPYEWHFSVGSVF